MLQVLNAWGNQLTALPDCFGSLSSLVRLGLKGNQLAALPPSFTALTNLVELFLTDNKLTTLPAGVLTQKLHACASYECRACKGEGVGVCAFVQVCCARLVCCSTVARSRVLMQRRGAQCQKATVEAIVGARPLAAACQQGRQGRRCDIKPDQQLTCN